MPDVLFINMPWSAANVPSLGLALLTSVLEEQESIDAETWYGNLHYSELLLEHFQSLDDLTPFAGSDGIQRLARFCRQEYYSRDLVDDYLFSSFDRLTADFDDDAFWNVFTEHRENRETVALWKEARKLVGPFLDSALEQVLAYDCDIVGFTSMFGQNMASIKLAERIKAARPQTKILFGGANCDGEMGGALLRNFDCIDYVFSGESEVAAPMMIRRLVDGETSAKDIPGIIWRDGGEFRHNGTSLPFDDLESLPLPDYSSYFDALDHCGYADQVRPTVFLEQSRGCWWGQKHHCTFCGLNSLGMVYRKKSDERCFEELKLFAERYPSDTVHFADNILDMKKFGSFMQRVHEADLGLKLFFEIKANISRERMRELADAGVYSVQPGIENLSDRVLKEMRKGVSGLQNVLCLKWAKQYGINALWNLLYGFPGETPEDFARNLDMLKSITHLDRSQCVEKIIMQRFSPNYDQAEELGFTNIRPWKTYQFIYDLPPDELMKISYSFDYDYAQPPAIEEALIELRDFNDAWGACDNPGTITYMALEDGGAIILDTRFNLPDQVRRLSARENAILRYIDTIRGRRHVVAFGLANGWDDESDIRAFLDSLEEQRFLVREGERVVGVIPLPDTADAVADRAA